MKVRSFSVRVLPARAVKGPRWAAKYPERAEEPWLEVYVRREGEPGKRQRERVGPDTPEAWAEAARRAADLEAALRERQGEPHRALRSPTVAEAMDRYLERGTGHLAPSTRAARRQQLHHLRPALGGVRLDELKPADVTAWWASYVERGGRDVRTGMGHVEALNRVVADAVFHGVDIQNPVPEARRRIQERYRRTKALRGRDQANKRPLTADQVVAVAAQLAEWPDQDARLACFLLLDAGLRFGEALALTWADCDRPDRLRVARSLNLSGQPGPTKTGRPRDVALSRRLWHLLQERRLACGRPRRHVRVLRWKSRARYRRALQAVADAAAVGRQLRPKDMRDTYACQLLTQGIPLAYISGQLGHEQVTTTARHYASWIDQDGYRNPPPVADEEVPADLLARLVTNVSPHATKPEKAKR